MTQEGGLPEFFEALRWRWPPAVLVALAVFLGATLYVERLPAKYDSTAVVAVGPRVEVETAGADTVRVVAPKYVAYLEAAGTAELVGPKISEDPLDIEDAIDASLAPDTGNVSVTARMATPERAAAVANGYAQQALEFSERDPLLRGDIVAEALPPGGPSSPPRRLLEAASLVIGLLLGTGVSLLIERGRPRLRSWRQIAKMTGYPVLGRVPSSRVLRQRPMESLADPVIGSAFRSLRANIEPQLREQDLDLLLVTSPQKGDGKTTVAALLAESMARLGMSTLLVDADLKRPRLAKLARIEDASGLDDILRGRSTLDQATRPGWAEGLSLLPTGIDPEAGDLLARSFVDVIAEARERFDLIVVDAPPLLGTDDARTLAPVAQAIVLVVSAGSEASQVNEAVLAVEALKAPLLGIVGNRLKESRRNYYY